MIDERGLREMLERRARTISATPTEAPTAVRRAHRRLVRNGAVAAFAGLVVVLGAFAGVKTIEAAPTPADHPTPSVTPPPSGVQRRGAETLVYKGGAEFGNPGDILAVDPSSGETRILVRADQIQGQLDAAAWSADGRMLAFGVNGCSPDAPDAGIWIADAPGNARRVSEMPCGTDPEAWNSQVFAWSPTTSQLVVVRALAKDASLVLIDAATGDQTDLGAATGEVTGALVWSPDGTRVIYAAGHSIYSVNVEDGVHSLLAGSVGYVQPYWRAPGIGPAGMSWSPDGSHLLFGTDRLYVMNPDGSGVRELLEAGAELAGFAWAPDGSTIAVGTYSQEGSDRRFQISTMSLEDPTRFLVYEAPVSSARDTAEHNNSLMPVWSPDGTQIAYRIGYNDTWGHPVYVVVNADGTGDARSLDGVVYRSWRGGWYHCECYG
jgi:Tol biopolymer transport system component